MYLCALGGDEVRILKKFKFRLQVVLDMRENELEQRRLEAAKILVALRKQEGELQEIRNCQLENSNQLENLYNQNVLDILQIESHRKYGLKLDIDEKNKERIIANTKVLFQRKQLDVQEAHKKVEILKKLKEKQEKEYEHICNLSNWWQTISRCKRRYYQG